MKNTKNIFLLIVSIITLSNAQQLFSEPVIEIYNKTNESIQVNIADVIGNTTKDITTAYVAPAQQWNSGARAITLNNKLHIEVATKANSTPKAFIIDAPGKTKYLSWDSAKSQPLYPQTGPLLGLMGKTKSGLPLNNNVKAENITSTKPLTALQMPPKPNPAQPKQTQQKNPIDEFPGAKNITDKYQRSLLILGVQEGANAQDIKKAYYKLALKWHPDKHPANTTYAKEVFQLIQDAYEYLNK
jgi:DnaJ domain